MAFVQCLKEAPSTITTTKYPEIFLWVLKMTVIRPNNMNNVRSVIEAMSGRMHRSQQLEWLSQALNQYMGVDYLDVPVTTPATYVPKIRLALDWSIKLLEPGKALLKAATGAYLLEVQWLLKMRPDLDQIWCERALRDASAKENDKCLDVVNFLITKVLDVDKGDTIDGNTALMKAVYNNNALIVKVLLTKASVNVANMQKKTALMKAMERLPSNDDIVNMLMEKTPDVNAVDTQGSTALFYAADVGNVRFVEMLINNDYSVDAIDIGGETALMYASSKNRKEAVKKLIDMHANVDLQSKNGETALMKAVTLRNTDTVEILIDNKADVNLQSNNGETALMKAAFAQDRKTMKMLIQANANVNLQDNKGQTIRNYAAVALPQSNILDQQLQNKIINDIFQRIAI